MKSLLLRTGQKIGRFFWSRGFLYFVIGLTALILAFYAEEDWRGAHAWAATKAKWEAKGESFDLNKFVPPPVPDEQNLAGIPLFKLTRISKNELSFQALHRALPPELKLSLGRWQDGQPPPMAEIEQSIQAAYSLAFKNAPPASPLAQLDALYPFLGDLRSSSATRPLCRFEIDYTGSTFFRPFTPTTDIIHLSSLLTVHSLLALKEQKSDVALADIQTNFQILGGLRKDPSLISNLIAVTMAKMNGEALYEGLAADAWNDEQLVEIDRTLRIFNALTTFQLGLRSEAISLCSLVDFTENHALQPNLTTVLFGNLGDAPQTLRTVPFWPAGWWNQSRKQLVNSLLAQLDTVDPAKHRAFPNLEDKLEDQDMEQLDRWDAEAPWNVWWMVILGSRTRPLPTFAETQVLLDQARIACALERYRIVHHEYPMSLFELVPSFAVELPNDIFSGKPYRYRLNPDGTYLLYSVGWNQTDDGGHIAFEKYSPSKRDYRQGDWVWPAPENK